MASAGVAQYALTIEQGTTFELVLTWNQPNGTPVDLTGYTSKIHVADNLSNKNSLLEWNSVSGGTPGTSLVLGGSSGTVTIGLTAAASSALTFTNGIYSLFVNSAGGIITKLIEGSFSVNPGLSW